MKTKLFGYLLAILLLISFSGFGQPKDYPVKKINGVEYYEYTVQASEGLFAIGRKFEISPDEISKANPEIKNGLKAGQHLLIPVQKKNQKNIFSESNSKPEFIEHTVLKKQTLFAISRKYNANQDDIKKYNPEIQNGLQEGMVLKIPVQVKETRKKEAEVEKAEKKASKDNKEAKKNILIHVVQPDETLYSISRQYKVDVNEIIELNPASATTLVSGTELKIPAKQGTIATATQTTSQKNNVTNGNKQDNDVNNLFDTSVLTKTSDKNKIIRIAFLLPFMLDQEKKDAGIDRFVDFYQGALLAVLEAKLKGISFEIYSYDTEKSEEKLSEVLSNSELKTMDLIIGPAFSNQVSLISDYAKENRINTLIPFTSKVSDIETNPYLFQFNPGTETELSFATELFTGKYKNMNIVFAEIPGVSSMDEGKMWAAGLQKELKKANKTFSKLELTTSDAADFGSVLKTDGKNLVIFNTDKFAFVSPFLNPLRVAATQYDLLLFEQYSWKNQNEKMPAGIYISPFMFNVNQDKLDDYSKQFTNYFGKNSNKDLPHFDLLGYDLTSYFISIFQRYGNKFSDKIGSYNFKNGLQSQPKFERISNGSGFVNQRVYLGED
ncbi:MAG TPA: LysM peptidoglycan-binding domain-containing protein [Paludibacter sp.]